MTGRLKIAFAGSCVVSTVRAVFVTDSHKNHYNLLRTYLGGFLRSADGSSLMPTFYLRGARREWEEKAVPGDPSFPGFLDNWEVIFTGESRFFAESKSRKTI